MAKERFTVLLVEHDLNDIYWGLECAKPELEIA
jgi:hypothetical protein